jgi:hypothetical protein
MARADFFRVCETYLDHDREMTLEPAGEAMPIDSELLGSQETRSY